jgi:hypothetical protein
LFGGHVTLQVRYEADSAQIGWWPEHWNLSSSGNKPWWLKKKYRNWIPYHNGKRTKYATLGEQPGEINPELFDSFMVRGRQETTLPTTRVAEALPSGIHYLCIKDIQQVLISVKTFNTKNDQYHAILNNCATMSAGALRAGGVSIPKWRITSPRRLSSFCEQKLVCSASKPA